MATTLCPQKPKTKFSTDDIVLIVVAISGFLTVYVQVAALFGMAVFALVKRRSMWKDRIPEAVLLGGFCALAITVTAVYGSWIMILLSCALIFACVDIIYVSKYLTISTFNIITEIVCFSSVPCIAVALIQKALGMTWEYGDRYCSVFFNANFYGLVAAMTILICIHRMCQTKRPLQFVAYIVFGIVSICAIYLTGSRMPIIVVTVGIFCYFAISRRWRALVIFAVVACALVGIDVLLGETLDIIPRMGDVAESFNGRWEIWRNAVASIRERPLFGYGTYSYSRVYQELGGWYAIHAHNIILEILMDYGVLGLSILVAFFSRVIIQSAKATSIAGDKYRQGMVAATFVITILSGMFDLAMFWPQTAAILCFAMSCGRAAGEPLQENN